jgi:hypothetical protein
MRSVHANWWSLKPHNTRDATGLVKIIKATIGMLQNRLMCSASKALPFALKAQIVSTRPFGGTSTRF